MSTLTDAEVEEHTAVPLDELGDAERAATLDRLARRYLQMGGAEFTRAWTAGAYADDDRPQVRRVAGMLV